MYPYICARVCVRVCVCVRMYIRIHLDTLIPFGVSGVVTDLKEQAWWMTGLPTSLQAHENECKLSWRTKNLLF